MAERERLPVWGAFISRRVGTRSFWPLSREGREGHLLLESRYLLLPARGRAHMLTGRPSMAASSHARALQLLLPAGETRAQAAAAAVHGAGGTRPSAARRRAEHIQQLQRIASSIGALLVSMQQDAGMVEESQRLEGRGEDRVEDVRAAAGSERLAQQKRSRTDVRVNLDKDELAHVSMVRETRAASSRMVQHPSCARPLPCSHPR